MIDGPTDEEMFDEEYEEVLTETSNINVFKYH